MKQSFGLGQGQQGQGGQAGSGWGIGTTPYKAWGSESQGLAPDSGRMNGEDSLMDTGTTSFDQFYDSQDMAHGASDKQVHGQFNPMAPPQKVEEVKSAPESQEALREFVNTLGAENIGDQQAIDNQNIPRDYKELHRRYFDNLKKATDEKKAAEQAAKDAAEKDAKPFEPKKDEKKDG